MSHIEDVMRVYADAHAMLTIEYVPDMLSFLAMINDDNGECVGGSANTLEEALSILNQRCWDEILAEMPA